VFRLVDRWRVGRQTQGQAPAVSSADGVVEVHERPVVAMTARLSVVAAERPLYQVAPDEGFTANFVSGSARTMKAQAGLLAVFVGVMIVLLAQGLPQPEPAFEQTVAVQVQR
jgi:hypothetical protein